MKKKDTGLTSFSKKDRERLKAPDRYRGPGRRDRPLPDDILIGDEGSDYKDPYDRLEDINARPNAERIGQALVREPKTVEPWLRLDGEPMRQWRAFVAYRDLGLKRSPQRTADIAGESLNTVLLWMPRWQWGFRVEQFDRYVAKLAANSVATEHAQMLQRHIGISVELQKKALARLANMDPGELTPREALWYLKEAVAIERAARMDPSDMPDIIDGKIVDGEESASSQEYISDVFHVLIEAGALPEDSTFDQITGETDAEADEVYPA